MLSKRSFVLIHLVALLGATTHLSAAPKATDAMNWVSDLATAQADAIRSGKLILIHFSGDACAPCARVAKNVFSQPAVGHRVNSKFVPVYINADAQPHIARQFQVASWPTDLVLTPAGQELHRMTSPQDPRVYLAELGKSVWRAQNMGTSAAQQVAQQQTSTSQTPRQQVAQQAVDQRQVPQQRVAQQSVPQQPAAYLQRQTSIQRPSPYAQQIANVQPAQSRPVTSAVAQVAPAATPQVAPAAALTLAPANATRPARAIAKPPTQATATTPNLRRPLTQVSPARKSPTGNTIATPTIATPRGDLYPPSRLEQPTHQLQTHAEPMVISNPMAQAGRIPAVASRPSGVRQTNYQQSEDQSQQTQLPNGQNPFNGTAMQTDSSGPVMLNNPFIRSSKPAPTPTQAVRPQPQMQAQPQMQVQYQPQPQIAPQPKQQYQPQLEPQPQTHLTHQMSPQPARAELVAPEARVAQVEPTPALTPATPPAKPEELDTPAPTESIAMDGYCCVTLHHEEKWVKGDPAWGALHRGSVYLFHSAGAQERFLSDPDKYSPLLSGYDPVVFHETGELKSGHRMHGVRYQDMTCLFNSEESLERFWESPLRYAQTAAQAMRSDTSVR